MEPQSPVLLKSRETVGCYRSDTTSWVPEEKETPVHRVKEDLDQEWWSFCVGKPSRWNRPTKKWTSTFDSVFADGGISIRVQKPPLETSTTTTTTTDEERDEVGDGDEDVSRTRDTIAGLEACEEFAEDGNGESFVRCELRGLPEANTRVSSQADVDELDEIEQLESSQDYNGTPIAAPVRSSRSGGGNAGAHAAGAAGVRLLSPSPSLSTPVMEKMEAAAASLEVPCPWNKREIVRSGEQSEGFVRAQGELLHPSTTRVVDPTTTRMVDPTTTRVVDPTTTRVVDPTTTRVVDPTTTRMVDPTTTRVVDPTTTRMVDPTTTRVVDPTTTRVVDPTTTRVVDPTTTRMVDPTTTRVVDPTTTRVVDPTTTRVVDPTTTRMVDRVWDGEATVKPKDDRDEQDGSVLGGDDDERARNGFSSLDDGGGDDEIGKEMSSPNSEIPMNLRTLNLRSRRTIARKLPKVPQEDFDEELEHDHPFPSSIIRALSPTSLFSYKQEPFQPSVASGDDILSTFQQFCDSGASSCEEIRNGSFRRSPRSVLLQDSDETSQCTSDSSGTTGKKRLHKQQQQQHHQHQHQQQQQQQKQTSSFFYLYNDGDESSDLESPLQCKFRHELVQPPFAAFTYSVGTAMLATSPSSAASTSADEAEFADLADFAGPVQELGFFHEAKLREPWLVNDGGVLDDLDDLEYLSSPDLKARNTTTTLVAIALPLCSPELRNGLPVFIQSPPSEEMPEGADRKAKRESLKTKLERHKAKFEIPKARHDSPKAKDNSLKPKPESRRTRPTVPKPKPESPKTKHESPKTKPVSPKTKPDSPKTKPESPKTKSESLKTKQESPKTEHESPKTEHDRPKVKHDSERGPKSEKKWVPFVTSSLHCNKPAQVCNPVAKGSPKSTNQERIPSSRKAPKRCVKFAPDLVNFAPDFVREIPDSATTPAALDRKQQRANPTAIKKQNSQPLPTVNTIPVAAPVRSKPKSKAWEVEEEDDDDEDGPSIMNSRRRSRWRHRDVEESKFSLGSTGRRERIGTSSSSPSCVERLLSWPRRLAHKANCRNVDSDDDDGSVGGVVVGERSFGMSSRRDAELVRRILKGSQQKYSNLTGDDILNEDFG